VREPAAIALGSVALVLEVVAVLGVVAMADTYDRLHYVSLASFGGVALGAAIFVAEGPSMIAVKAGLTVLVLMSTAPVLTHATARAVRDRERRGERRRG
jgi:monovalent cation/proton antiporter MnhG/PhaG subunit